MRILPALALACAFFVAGCASHPLPEDVTRETTVQIVRKIQCEGRQALDNISVDLIRKSSDYPPLLELADRVEAGELTVIELMRNPKYRSARQHLPQNAQTLFQAYTMTAATFDFDFLITETRNQHAHASWNWPFTHGLGTLGGVNAGAKLERQTDRKFMITKSFFELHKQKRFEDCEAIMARVGHVVYPITGIIGLEELFRTFVTLDSAGGQGDATHKFSDAFVFTTTLSSGVTPKIALNAGPINDIRLAEASLDFSASRVDVHKVTISLARGDSIKSVEEAQFIAKRKSRIIAEDRRTEDLFIAPRR
jgi:hypothetical protein